MMCADAQVRLQGAARGCRQPEAGSGDHPAEDRSTTTQHQRHRQLGVEDSDASRFLGERGHDAALAPFAGEHQDRHHWQEDHQSDGGDPEVARVGLIEARRGEDRHQHDPSGRQGHESEEPASSAGIGGLGPLDPDKP